MALGADELLQIDKLLSTPDCGAAVVVELRRLFPHLAWTRCDASDVADEPFRSYPRFDIHLLDTADHCAQITADPTRATGIILAGRSAGS